MNEQFFIAECDEAMYPIAERLGKLAAQVLPDHQYMHKFEKLWRDVVKYSDVLDHVKGRSAKDPHTWGRPLSQEDCAGLEGFASPGDIFATVFGRTLEQQVIPLLKNAARRAGRDPKTVEGHAWVMSRFRKFGDMLFTEYNFSLAIR